MVSFGKQISRGINKTFSKRAVSNALGKVGGEIIRTGDIAGQVASGAGMAAQGAGYLTGDPLLVGAGKAVSAGGAVLSGSSKVGKGIQKARRNY
jgi:hypothetical protein